MHLDYPQKMRLLDHFSKRANWRNQFDMNFFMDDMRKASSHQVTPTASRTVNRTGTKVHVEHKSGSALSFAIEKDRVVIVDESGTTFTYGGESAFAHQQSLSITPVKPAAHNVVEVPGTDIAVIFDGVGNKAVIIGAYQVNLPACAERPVKPVQKGAQIHVASISDALAAGWGIPPFDLADVTKLVVACDFGLELGIEAINAPAGYRIVQPELPANVTTLRPDQRTHLNIVQKPWRDTTEFEGHDVSSPRTFFVEADDAGLNLITSLDQREAIWSQGDVLHAALSTGAPPVQTVTSRTQAHHMLNLLTRGAVTRDTRGREWNYVVVETQHSLDIATKLRKAMRHEFGLTARHCSVMTYDKGLCILAMASKVLDAAAEHSHNMHEGSYADAIRKAAQESKFTI
jgi:hypothetical protein